MHFELVCATIKQKRYLQSTERKIQGKIISHTKQTYTIVHKLTQTQNIRNLKKKIVLNAKKSEIVILRHISIYLVEQKKNVSKNTEEEQEQGKKKPTTLKKRQLGDCK